MLTATQKQSKAAREAAARRKLAEDWPDFPDIFDAIDEYEARETAEARFVYALDKVMPALLNYINEGDVWRQFGITFERYAAEKEAKVPVSPEIYEYYRQLTLILQDHPDYFAPSDSPA